MNGTPTRNPTRKSKAGARGWLCTGDDPENHTPEDSQWLMDPPPE